jgi:serine/threonine-protein kinase SRPK3
MSTEIAPENLSGNASDPESPQWIYEPMEDVEPFERYRAGGYYPVRIGDQFCSSRYRIVHKLGHGASSTIWLARDERLAKYVAIKFAVSELARPFESAILKKLWDKDGCTIRSHAGVPLIPDILDEFEVEGPEFNGVKSKHHCLVTTAARMSISQARDASSNGLFQPTVARAIAAQIIQAVASLHSRGVVHAGRLSVRRVETSPRFADSNIRSSRGQCSLLFAQCYSRPYLRPALSEV